MARLAKVDLQFPASYHVSCNYCSRTCSNYRFNCSANGVEHHWNPKTLQHGQYGAAAALPGRFGLSYLSECDVWPMISNTKSPSVRWITKAPRPPEQLPDMPAPRYWQPRITKPAGPKHPPR